MMFEQNAQRELMNEQEWHERFIKFDHNMVKRQQNFVQLVKPHLAIPDV